MNNISHSLKDDDEKIVKLLKKSKEPMFSFMYETPYSLSMDDWELWRKEMKEKYPFQYWLREDVYFWLTSWKRRWEDFYYEINCFFNPKNQEIRKAIPKTWMDISSLVVDVNRAMILSFKKEADEGFIDWNADEGHKNFKNWLDAAAKWFTEDKPNLEKQRDAAYPPYPLPIEMKEYSYDQLYGKVNELEKTIEDTDSKILKEMIDFRQYMWT